MKKLLVVLALCTLSALPARAAGGPKGLGLGLTLGSPTGLTGKYFLTNIHAIDAAFGTSDDPDFYVDYLWHGWEAFAQPKQGRLAAILGVGARLESEPGDDSLGIRGVLGAAYYLQDVPLELTLEVAPVINVTGNTGGDMDVGLTVRYYFTRFN